jgi:hypothetical protein
VDDVAGGVSETDLFEKKVLGRFDAPAYVRRARAVEESLKSLVLECRGKRDALALMPRLRVGRLRLQAGGDWSALRPFLADDDQPAVLQALHDELRPVLRAPVAPLTADRRLRKALRELVASVEGLNRRWLEHLPTADRSAVDAARDLYNRYYLLEKECAVRSPSLARLGYRPLKLMTLDELLVLVPPLPVPRLAP